MPPPRTRRGLATKSAKNKLKELHIAAESLEIVANELVNIGETLDMSSSSTTTVPHNGNYLWSMSNQQEAGQLRIFHIATKNYYKTFHDIV